MIKEWSVFKLKSPKDNKVYVKIKKILKRNLVCYYNVVEEFKEDVDYNVCITKEEDMEI